ncbi:hypothetical protein AKJ09_03780 [Labilithrix luteola]|uniref:Uncharacterized protein n=1 Tax=Labilithrix luteola TaxID=1391654 RepID=A0A0K1PUR0_9BACT|nr:hypothetical protein AKJ09_03780 [Labilithrix luteola]
MTTTRRPSAATTETPRTKVFRSIDGSFIEYDRHACRSSRRAVARVSLERNSTRDQDEAGLVIALIDLEDALTS